jgi:hypothetical protein
MRTCATGAAPSHSSAAIVFSGESGCESGTPSSSTPSVAQSCLLSQRVAAVRSGRRQPEAMKRDTADNEDPYSAGIDLSGRVLLSYSEYPGPVKEACRYLSLCDWGTNPMFEDLAPRQTVRVLAALNAVSANAPLLELVQGRAR